MKKIREFLSSDAVVSGVLIAIVLKIFGMDSNYSYILVSFILATGLIKYYLKEKEKNQKEK